MTHAPRPSALISALRQAVQAENSTQRDALFDEIDAKLQTLEALERQIGYFPLGHFHSAYPGEEAIAQFERQENAPQAPTLPEIDLNPDGQLRLLSHLVTYGTMAPFRGERIDGLRYYADNIFFDLTDATVLYAMIRHFQPKRMIEIGSGYSSAVMLDANELHFDNAIQCTFIEPYAERFRSLLKPEDGERIQLIEQPLQEVDLELFQSLEANDIIFIDSSHVAKVGSDVNHILFNVLPLLKEGVLIHFHDIFHPFTYPSDWLRKGMFWNEAYVLRAFLANNTQYRIVFFSHYMNQFHRDAFEGLSPYLKEKGLWGCGLWLQKGEFTP